MIYVWRRNDLETCFGVVAVKDFIVYLITEVMILDKSLAMMLQGRGLRDVYALVNAGCKRVSRIKAMKITVLKIKA